MTKIYKIKNWIALKQINNRLKELQQERDKIKTLSRRNVPCWLSTWWFKNMAAEMETIRLLNEIKNS